LPLTASTLSVTQTACAAAVAVPVAGVLTVGTGKPAAQHIVLQNGGLWAGGRLAAAALTAASVELSDDLTVRALTSTLLVSSGLSCAQG
jgi:hypothetical protein